MDVRNCRGCGRIFNYVAGPVMCQRCRESLEGKFQEVKEYIRANPGATIPEVSEACEVESAQIRQWLREERLEITEGSALYLNCEGCGMPIRSGRYCDKCKNEMTRGLNNILHESRPKPAVQQPKDKENPKMRFL